jgi:hypothetical protein
VRNDITGPKDSKNPLRTANCWGSDLSPVYYDKQKVLIDHPRLRGKNNKEIPIATFQAFQNSKAMRNSVIKNMVLGISSRNYEKAVEGFIRQVIVANVYDSDVMKILSILPFFIIFFVVRSRYLRFMG